MKSSAVVVVGLGYVGLPLALLARRKGYEVQGVDTSAAKVAAVKKRYKALRASKQYTAVARSEIIIICVPTPVTNNCEPDLRPLEKACKRVAGYLQKDQLVIIESTINPGVCEEIVVPLLEGVTGLECGKDFSLAHCPERINPGDPEWNVESIPRVVAALMSRAQKGRWHFIAAF